MTKYSTTRRHKYGRDWNDTAKHSNNNNKKKIIKYNNY